MELRLSLILVTVLVRLGYFPLNARRQTRYWQTRLDNYIPLVPWFVFIYMCYVPYELVALALLFRHPILIPFLQSYIITNVLALIFWYFYPNGVKKPKLTKNDFFTKALSNLYAHNGEGNGFPSGHVFGAFITTYFLILGTGSYLWLIPGILIAASTVLVKQHYVVDIFGGIIWSLLGISLARIF